MYTAMYSLCAQVHEFPQNHCGDNQECTLFSWYIYIYISVCVCVCVWCVCVIHQKYRNIPSHWHNPRQLPKNNMLNTSGRQRWTRLLIMKRATPAYITYMVYIILTQLAMAISRFSFSYFCLKLFFNFLNF